MTLASSNRWIELAEQVLAGMPLDCHQARSVLQSPDVELLNVLAAAYRVRYRYFQNTVQLYFLINAKSGLCPEDCAYCSQSRVAASGIDRYRLLSAEKILEGARAAYERQSRTYCIVISGRGPSEGELRAITAVVPEIKRRFDLKICVCLGLLSLQQAVQLKGCGVDRVNHNLNTSPEFYPQICSTHSYEDRIQTLRAVRQAGMELCSGGIVGMGESDDDVVRMAFQLRELDVESIPVNFLHPIEGTPLAGVQRLNPRYCLKVLAMFRLVNPSRELRIAGGRELHLGSMQCLGLYPANSLFVGDYLTTKGQLPEEDYRMIREMGFVITRAKEWELQIAN